MLDAFKELGFHYATQAGITVSKNDVVSPPNKEEILERYEAEAAEIMSQYEEGYITAEERKESVTARWDRATEEVAQAMEDNLDELNPIFMMANSGARGSFKQIRQLAGMRGLMANPKGEIIERPIKANFMEGLSVLEYFISTHGARKGLADTALRTADSGYLTRRLVDVAQDVIVRTEDCKTKDFIEMTLLPETASRTRTCSVAWSAKKFATKRGRELLKREPDDRQAGAGTSSPRPSRTTTTSTVPVRSVLKCEAESGRVPQCYGVMPATGAIVEIGDAVGIIAAQSIGEPGTQLTMRTFHTGGVAGLDITQGLPRVVELFEARKPKGLAQIAEVAGKVAVEETDKAIKVTSPTTRARSTTTPFPPAPASRRARASRSRPAPSSTRARSTRPSCWRSAGAPRPRSTSWARCSRSTAAGRRHQRQAHRADHPPDAEEGARSTRRARPSSCPASSRTAMIFKRSTRRSRPRRRHAGAGRGGDPRDHQGVAGDGVLPLGGLLPGDDQGAHRRGPRGQAGPPRRPEGERHHRQADPGGDRPQALPHARDRAGRAGPAPDEELLYDEELAAELGLAGDGEGAPSSRASAPRSPRSSRSSPRRSSSG